MPPHGNFWVDAHEDIACHCQEFRRDFIDPVDVPCMITLPWLMQTGVRLIFATYFVPHNGTPEQRRALLERQYEMYSDWLQLYPEQLRLVSSAADLRYLADAEPVDIPGDARERALHAALHHNLDAPALGYPVGIFFLMEGCDLLADPGELETWHARGLRLASLTWNGKNRYATGCFSDNAGLSDLGFELLGEFERLKMGLDLSHLCDAGVADVFERFTGPLCATHSNARGLCQHERNLTDEQAAEVARRGGVIGLNLLDTFVQTGWRPGVPLPDLRAAMDHVVHFAELLGAQHVGLGSDLDGGLTPENTPIGIDTVLDLPLLADELKSRGWDSARIAGFCGANWWSWLERLLPA